MISTDFLWLPTSLDRETFLRGYSSGGIKKSFLELSRPLVCTMLYQWNTIAIWNQIKWVVFGNLKKNPAIQFMLMIAARNFNPFAGVVSLNLLHLYIIIFVCYQNENTINIWYISDILHQFAKINKLRLAVGFRPKSQAPSRARNISRPVTKTLW